MRCAFNLVDTPNVTPLQQISRGVGLFAVYLWRVIAWCDCSRFTRFAELLQDLLNGSKWLSRLLSSHLLPSALPRLKEKIVRTLPVQMALAACASTVARGLAAVEKNSFLVDLLIKLRLLASPAEHKLAAEHRMEDRALLPHLVHPAFAAEATAATAMEGAPAALAAAATATAMCAAPTIT
jgi:hypothetical protein